MIVSIKQISPKTALLLLFYSFFLGATAWTAEPEESIDLSILDRQDSLEVLLSPSKRIEITKAEAIIRQGISDVRSGTYLTEQKVTAFNTKQKVEESQKRGEMLIAQGKSRTLEGQKMLVALLKEAEAIEKVLAADKIKKYQSDLQKYSYEEALKLAAESLLAETRRLEYDNVMFDGIHLNNGASVARAPESVRDQAYAVFLEADGTNFSLTRPVALRFEEGATGTKGTFAFDNEAAFRGQRSALLAIELIAEEGHGNGLLYARTVDIDTLQIQSIFVALVTNYPGEDATSEDTVMAEDNVKESSEELDSSDTPVTELSVTIEADQSLVERIGNLAPPYQFNIVANSFATGLEAEKIKAATMDNFFSVSGWYFVENEFIARAYTPESQSLPNISTAELTIDQKEPEASAPQYTLSAKAGASQRVIEVGTMRTATQIQ